MIPKLVYKKNCGIRVQPKRFNQHRDGGAATSALTLCGLPKEDDARFHIRAVFCLQLTTQLFILRPLTCSIIHLSNQIISIPQNIHAKPRNKP